MFIAMRKKPTLAAVLATAVLLAVLLCVVSCSTYTVKDSEIIEKVDKKIISEFYEGTEADDFFGACRSYIEFLNCCNDSRKDELTNELEALYRKKIEELKASGDTLGLIQYSYSFVNVTRDKLPDERWERYREDVADYVWRFAAGELSSKSDLERASWLLYMTRFCPGGSFLYRELAELFLERKNLLLARKYFDIYMDLEIREQTTSHIEGFEELEDSIVQLEKEAAGNASSSEDAIENVIASSVKIFVDRGIKTEMGVGRPDQLLGTGVVIDSRGYIITNYHIIESSVDPRYDGYSRVYVIPGTDESTRHVAKIVGYDPIFDLALLKIEKDHPTYIQLGDSDTLRRGEKVVAIGNPIGLTNTVTGGIISSIDRPFFQIGNAIQIDAALNPGNSGGALIDSDGYLVGIAFAGLEQFENLNFAIPSNLMLSILFRLYEGGEVRRSWMGCYVAKTENGVTVDYIVPDNPASIFRFVKGDVITEVNGMAVSDIYTVQEALSLFGGPTTAVLTIQRDSERVYKYILVSERPVYPSELIYKKDTYENVLTPLFGLVVNRVGSPVSKSYVVTRIISSSVASSIGITEGDTIRVKRIDYDEKARVFSLIVDLKSKRFGYMNKQIVLYSRTGVSNFI
jgi:S1-C subfamily serine protease